MFLILILSFVCLGSGVPSSLFTPCKVTDIPCLENSINNALPPIFDGIPELEIESSDPQFNEYLEINVPDLNLKFFNSTISGYKTCKLSNLRLQPNLTKASFDWNCPELTAVGQYNMKGRLGTLPVEGNGDFKFVAGKFLVNIDCEVDKVKNDDGKTLASIKDFKFVAKPLTKVVYDFRNLFNGREDLAAGVHEYARNNWKSVAELVKDPIWDASLKKIFKNLNKFFETSPIEDTLIHS
ncbi:protein takeout-like [Melitaea cinxia]|uniref:protein takeout-like n=1 Tax=Melitaea cinxia TaxID=113334 RepID=UPI001E273E77|nr:protein takeout-like [Melitaea cinxia]